LNFQRFKGWPIGFALLMLVLASAATSMYVQPETFLGLASFRELATNAQLSSQDSFAYTPTHPRIDYPYWGMGPILYSSMVISGWGTKGLLVLTYLFCFGIAISCHGLSVRQGVRLPTFALLALIPLSVAIPLGVAEIQPSLASGVALVVLYNLIWADRTRGGYWLWATVPLLGLWSNLQDGALLGLIILAAYCLTRLAQQYRDSRFRKAGTERDFYLWLILLAASAAILLNPSGGKLFSHFFVLIANHSGWSMDQHPFWQTHTILTQILFLFSILVAAYGIHLARPWPVFESLVLLLTCVFAINHPSFEMMYLVSWICLVPPLIQATPAGSVIQDGFLRHSFPIISASFAIGLVGLGLAIQHRFWELRLIGEPIAEGRNRMIYPIAATDFLAANRFSGNLMVPEKAGGYIAWRLFPQVKISADSRLHWVYPEQTVKQNRDFFLAVEGWSDLINESTDAILIPLQAPVFPALSRAIQERKVDWQQVYRDRGYAIFIRSGVEVDAPRVNSVSSVARDPSGQSNNQTSF
jgi:hypothetical protein